MRVSTSLIPAHWRAKIRKSADGVGRIGARGRSAAPQLMRTVYARHYGMRLHCSEAYYFVTPTVQLQTTVWDRLLSARGDVRGPWTCAAAAPARGRIGCARLSTRSDDALR